jgi:hypothetical protein
MTSWYKGRLEYGYVHFGTYLHRYKHQSQGKCSTSWESGNPGWCVWESGSLEAERELSLQVSPLLWTRTISGTHWEKGSNTRSLTAHRERERNQKGH